MKTLKDLLVANNFLTFFVEWCEATVEKNPHAKADFKINMSEMYGFLRINQLYKESFAYVFIWSLQIYKKFLQLLTNQGL